MQKCLTAANIQNCMVLNYNLWPTSHNRSHLSYLDIFMRTISRLAFDFPSIGRGRVMFISFLQFEMTESYIDLISFWHNDPPKAIVITGIWIGKIWTLDRSMIAGQSYIANWKSISVYYFYEFLNEQFRACESMQVVTKDVSYLYLALVDFCKMSFAYIKCPPSPLCRSISFI